MAAVPLRQWISEDYGSLGRAARRVRSRRIAGQGPDHMSPANALSTIARSTSSSGLALPMTIRPWLAATSPLARVTGSTAAGIWPRRWGRPRQPPRNGLSLLSAPGSMSSFGRGV